jgi:hypothetical protein
LKTASEIVNYLTRYIQQKNDENMTGLLPDQVNDLLGQMSEFLEERMEEDTPYQSVWRDFRRNPEDNTASLAGDLEALFEAQPAVRERVNGFMEKITAIEAKDSDQDFTKINIEDSLKSEPGGLVPDEGENSAIMADEKVEKNPPAYLYNNERAGFESDREAPVSKPFLVGENAQIIYVPTEKVQFPFMFMHLGRLTKTSHDLTLDQKEIVQQNIEIIRFQLTGERAYDEAEMANAFEEIWEIAPSYANALIESLQRNIDQLPLETRDFIIQLRSPLH